MTTVPRIRKKVAVVLAGWSLGFLPACQGAGIFGRDRTIVAPPPPPPPGAVVTGPAPAAVPYSAYRPAYSPGPPRRTLIFGNYAGYNYSYARPTGYIPTKYGVETWGYPEHPGAGHGLGLFRGRHGRD
jgi:hypothetical protein